MNINQIQKQKEEILSTMDNIKSKNTSKIAFKKLCEHFGGFNADEELFDFNYGDICATITLRNDNVALCDTCEVWDSNGLVVDNYNWMEEKSYA